MGHWEKVKCFLHAHPTVLLSIYGFLANCRPAEPFLTPYLVGPYKNISEEQLTNVLFPIWTYSYLGVLFPVFLLTDFLCYKPIIVVQGLFLVTNYILLCFAQGMGAMTFLQINYAVVTSCEVAYFSYIYSVVPPRLYQRVTGYLRGSVLAGYTFGALLGQLLISLVGMSYFYINTITLGTVALAFLVSMFLPMPQQGLFFRGAAETSPSQQGCSVEETRSRTAGGWYSRGNIDHARSLLWKNFKESYSSKQMIYWSLWWALATAGYGQVFNYIQLMWNHIEPSGTSVVYNGGVEAVSTLIGAVVVFAVGHVKVAWQVWGELTLGLFSAVGSGAIFLIGLSSNIWASYAGYVAFKASYMLLITITTFQIAGNQSISCYALTFGINTFIALLLQTVLTAIVIDDRVLGMDVVSQFIIYGSYYAVITLLFLIRGGYTASKDCCWSKRLKRNQNPEVLASERF